LRVARFLHDLSDLTRRVATMLPHIEVPVRPAVDRPTSTHARRNRAEIAVRERLAPVDDVYVLRSSWRVNGSGGEPSVAVIARNDEARRAARAALDEIGGLKGDAWQVGWTPLSLGDWMISVFPERSAQTEQ
jgi:hypothetical protein